MQVVYGVKYDSLCSPHGCCMQTVQRQTRTPDSIPKCRRLRGVTLLEKGEIVEKIKGVKNDLARAHFLPELLLL